MKILYVTDLHGNYSKYKKICSLLDTYKPDIVINGGDMYPKNAGSREQLKLEQKDFVNEYLPNIFEAFEDKKIYYLCMPGNDDFMMFDTLLEHQCSNFKYVHNIAQSIVSIGDYEFIGMNMVPDYPFGLKDRCLKDDFYFKFVPQRMAKPIISKIDGSEEFMEFEDVDIWFSFCSTNKPIDSLLKTLPEPKDIHKTIYVIHCPPARCKLDVCADGREVGSRSIYDFILLHQPLLTLHGHIHESPRMTNTWKHKIGSTIAVQPGQLKELTYVTVDLDTMDINRITT